MLTKFVFVYLSASHIKSNMELAKTIFVCAALAIAVSATSYEPNLCRFPKVFNDCPTSCPLTCDNVFNPPAFCTDDCRSGVNCVCPDGYVEKSDTDSRCVKKSSCKKKCSDLKTYVGCATACPIHCNNKDNPPRLCPAVCRPNINCVCRKGYIERSLTDFSCIKPSKCPDKCRKVKCYGDNEECKKGICVCKEGYARDRGKCVDACRMMKCGGDNEICKKGKCVCDDGYIKNDDICVDACILMLCQRGRICKKGRCLCPNGKPEVNGECPESCEDTDDCGKFQSCEEGQCVCVEGYEKVGDRCEAICPKPKLYRPCSTACPIHCGNVLNPPRRCTKNCRRDVQCVCPKGYVEKSETDFDCIRPSKCTSDECADGCGTYEECEGGKCVCIRGYDRVGSRCVDACRRIRCPRYSTCKAGRCNCDEGYVRQGSICVDECVLMDCREGYCEKGRCKCPEGFDEVDGECLDKCRRMRCSQDCKAGTCICKDGFTMVNGRCIDDCSVRCRSKGRVCVRGKCDCPVGYKENNYGKCVDLCKSMYCPGSCHKGRCVDLCGGSQCPPGSTCVRERCRCNARDGYLHFGCIPY